MGTFEPDVPTKEAGALKTCGLDDEHSAACQSLPRNAIWRRPADPFKHDAAYCAEVFRAIEDQPLQIVETPRPTK